MCPNRGRASRLSRMDIRKRIEQSLTLLVVACWVFLALPAAAQSGTPSLLSPEVAFHLKATRPEPSRLRLSWTIAPGYYLYRHALRFVTPDGEALTGVRLPLGEIKNDPYFGASEIYRDRLVVDLPLGREPERWPMLSVVSQGCADIGVCFPPQTQALNLNAGTGLLVPAVATPKSSPAAALARDPLAALTGAAAQKNAPAQFLSIDQAFPLELELLEPKLIYARWRIAEGYYLYRHGFRFEQFGGSEALPLEVEMPAGKAQIDPYFGPVETYRGDLQIHLPLKAAATGNPAEISISYQGCADAGLCFPPEQRSFLIDLAAGAIVEGGAEVEAGKVAAPIPDSPVGVLPFARVMNTRALDAALADAARRDASVMLEFYADWCVPCREMEARSFSDEQVQAALSGVVLLRADVTRASPDDRQLLRRFNLEGPPAILFFSRSGEERSDHRVIGFVGPKRFAARITRAIR